MELANSIRKLRTHLLMSQTEFGDAIGVVGATVNRWESGKLAPSVSVIKSIKKLCLENQYDFSEIEMAWSLRRSKKTNSSN